jgi:hypothetical protein
MPSSWPIVMTPVPPTPATTMPHGVSATGSAGSGIGGNVKGFGRSGEAVFFALFIWPPSTVTKLGQKPFTHE